MTVPKLSIELVPRTSFCNNLRNNLKSSDWDIVRRACYKSCNYSCEICGGKGSKHPVECHEIWEYDDDRKIQKLIRVIGLCPSCHAVKHYGLQMVRNRDLIAKKHLKTINNWSYSECDEYIQEVFKKWEQRSRYNWILDLEYITNQGFEIIENTNEED